METILRKKILLKLRKVQKLRGEGGQCTSFQPEAGKAKTIFDSFAHAFPRLVPAACLSEAWGFKF